MGLKPVGCRGEQERERIEAGENAALRAEGPSKARDLNLKCVLYMLEWFPFPPQNAWQSLCCNNNNN